MTLTNDLRPPRILTLDIETSPNVADVWGLWQQNVSINQLRESSRVLCFAAKWYDKKKVEFFSEHHDTREVMIEAAWVMLDECDILVTYNGPAFDVKHLQREFILAGFTPPSPFKNVDLLKVAKSQFKFPSNKLDYVAQALGVGKKIKHAGHELWTACLSGDDKAWDQMRKYNVQDVRLTEQVYDRLGSWIKTHPNFGVWVGDDVCPRCSSTNLKDHGVHVVGLLSYQRLCCDDCGMWCRGNEVVSRTAIRGVM